MNIIFGIIKESYLLLNEMSPYLLFGFLFAGILHVFIKKGIIARHLGGSDLSSVIKAALFGIPLPLCSCGVIPTAMSLRKEGASKGAVLSFLISTPTTGVDSIFATYALLGGVFAAYRVAASFIAGVVAGLSANIFVKNTNTVLTSKKEVKCKICHGKDHHLIKHNLSDKMKGAFIYAFCDLLKDVGKWLIIGILIGGAIAYFIPEEFISHYLGSGWLSMLIMLLVGVPMYICSSGSIPIAAALMLKGLSPGAAFVFLFAGPATNSAALTVITDQLGKKAAFIFLGTIIACSLILGILLNRIWQFLDIDTIKAIVHHGSIFPLWVKIVSSSLLLLGIFLPKIPKRGYSL